MIVFGLLIIIGYMYLFVNVVINLDDFKIINAKQMKDYQLEKVSLNEENVLVGGRINYDLVSDEIFNVNNDKNEAIGLVRIVEKRVDNDWIVVNKGDN